ncbi:MAG: NAD-dependent epimerase/dehydratase family protein [Oscillospiraceae bacterium]|nr:NAD-dependent epimerase/dehydratase family protein [Oscillospiraceae bacterium]
MIRNQQYLQDLQKAAVQLPDWQLLQDRSILISGATGMIGSFLVDLLMYQNNSIGLNCTVYALGRNEEKAQKRFAPYWDSPCFRFISCDINRSLDLDISRVDYILHAASNTHPVAYATDPIGTVATNIIGTHNLLEFAANHETKRFIFASTVEVYGENRGDTEYFAEDYCGYIDCNTLRAGYPESKRAGEALCQAYIKQKGLDVVIPRLSRVYGPTMLMSDTKALSQFIKNSLAGEDIVLKSAGTQFFSYSYVADAVTGILYCLMRGVCGEAYNVADPASDITLRDLAGLIAEQTGTKVIFQIPDAVESAGFSKATKAVLDSSKLRAMGWQPRWDIRAGIATTVKLLRNSL